jgi:3-dehydrosphinganine reductase
LHEENKIKPPETREIAGKQVKLLQPEDVAREVIRGIERNKYTIIPAFDMKLYFLLLNGIIAFARWYLDRAIAGSRKKRGLPPAYK